MFVLVLRFSMNETCIWWRSYLLFVYICMGFCRCQSGFLYRSWEMLNWGVNFIGKFQGNIKSKILIKYILKIRLVCLVGEEKRVFLWINRIFKPTSSRVCVWSEDKSLRLLRLLCTLLGSILITNFQDIQESIVVRVR